jgi:N6-L-threonylcarbamoyladenine synthase
VTYRPMAAQDVAAVAALESETFPEPHEAWSPPMVLDELAHRDRSCWVALLGGEIVGYVSGQIFAGQLSVLRIAVVRRARRAGIASGLLSRLIEDARSLGASEIILEVRESNAAAQALYGHFGLAEIARRPRYYSPLNGSKSAADREDAIVMSGPLPLAGSIVGGNSLADTPQSVPATPCILAIETSCDETAAAVVAGDGSLLADVIASQVDFHHRFGGVVPEIASRKHTEAISAVVEQALADAAVSLEQLDAIAVTYAPGLIGALVVGVAYAKGLSWATGKPLILVNHLEGHIYANKLASVDELASVDRLTSADRLKRVDRLTPPFVTALLSGGTTMLVHVRDWGDYQIMGQTLDDAVGEAFDKVAKALGLGYPGGPAIAKLAETGRPDAIDFPRALLHNHGYDFSLSGLKTAVITWLREQIAQGIKFKPEDVAASFQVAVIEVQVAKALAACREAGVSCFCVGGGVAANRALRAAYEQAMKLHGITVIYPPMIACTDNAAMIGLVALQRYAQGSFAALDADAQANANLELPY